ncbi:MAG: primase C-terminal domain-containing protein [Bryobacteraceae bacterium]
MRIPDDLLELRRWLLWHRENGDKVPYRPDGYKASTTDPRDWSDCEEVVRVLQQHPQRYSGIGFVLSEPDGLVGIDVDNCLEPVTGNPKEWCRGILERFADTYMEISPSNVGVKIWCRGRIPTSLSVKVEDGRIEIYGTARYFTFTGKVFRGAPLQVEDHTADLLSLCQHLTQNRVGPGGNPTYSIPNDGKIPKGVQHLTLVSLVGTLRRRKVCDEAIEACLQIVNQRQCEQPGPPRNISRIVRSSRRWGRS